MTDGDFTNPFNYAGGKHRELDWLLPLLPQRPRYVEPFGGSGSVLMNRPPAETETFNDINGDIVEFFRAIRDHPEELARELRNTPWSRREYEQCLETLGDSDFPTIERARAWYYVINATNSAANPTPGRWAYNVSTKPWAANSFRNKIEDTLPEVAERWGLVQIECKDALDIIGRYDSPDGLIYCDPPYPETQTGGLYPSDIDHQELREELSRCEADVAVSAYSDGVYEELYSDWNRREGPKTQISASTVSNDGGQKERSHVLFMNYNPAEDSGGEGQSSLGSFGGG